METRLTDFGIAGKIIRLQNFTNAKAVIDDELKKGVSAIVIVGNDKTFGHVLSRAATCEVLFGFLPVGENNSIAEILGIPVGLEATDVLARRRKINLDVGWFNNRYFVSQLYIPPSRISVEYDEKFKVSSEGLMELVVCNLEPYTKKGVKGKKDFIIHPQDGKLEAFLQPLKKRLWKVDYEEPSVFPFEEMIVSSKSPFVVEADGAVSKETKIKIKLARSRVELIVGRERKF
jgi:hypothetical protein